MSREQSIKSLLASTAEKPRGRKVIALVLFGVVMGGGSIAGAFYAYTQGYKNGIEVASTALDTKEATKVSYTSEPITNSRLLELPPPYEEVSATTQESVRAYY